MTESMDGQWMGPVFGDAPGLGILELDDFGRSVTGIAYHFPTDTALPGVAVHINTAHRELKHQIRGAKIVGVHPGLGVWLTPEGVEQYFPNAVVPERVDLDLEFLPDGSVDFSYDTNFTKGGGRLSKSQANEPSVLVPTDKVKSWDQFKAETFSVEPNRFFYRGQAAPKRLRTSFHRTRRKNLATYRDVDVNELRRALSSRLQHVFDPRDSIQTGAFYNLLQHHGYPTPLLDWSFSPFVAAYFAFRAASVGRFEADCVRLFVFDAKAWRDDFPQSPLTAYALPHFSIIELLGIENPRMVPQQATTTITNLDDIEAYIVQMGVRNGKEYLSVIDLPLSERQQALSELDLMGINAGSLFPGLDGACEALRYKNFGA